MASLTHVNSVLTEPFDQLATKRPERAGIELERCGHQVPAMAGGAGGAAAKRRHPRSPARPYRRRVPLSDRAAGRWRRRPRSAPSPGQRAVATNARISGALMREQPRFLRAKTGATPAMPFPGSRCGRAAQDCCRRSHLAVEVGGGVHDHHAVELLRKQRHVFLIEDATSMALRLGHEPAGLAAHRNDRNLVPPEVRCRASRGS